ncbi:MAG: monosaccharide transporter substrate-binding protein family [Chthonomonadales bacterium]|nr:monosaccharide transporter substrate-binding protein family [Chthonomonadales bacterium]
MRSHRHNAARTGTRLFLLGLAVMALAGCTKEETNTGAPPSNGNPNPTSTGSPPPPTSSGAKKKIVFVFKVGGISYSEACKAGAQQANDDPALNVEVTYQAPTEATAAAQNSIIEQAIISKVDAIVVSPNDADAIIPSIKKASDAGIKVYTWDSDAPKSARTFYVRAADDVQIGVDILDAVAKSAGGKGKILLFSGGRTAANLNLHIQGIEEAAKKLTDVKLVQPYIYNDDDKSKATTMAVQALQANPDAVGIACVISPSPAAAGEALKKLNLIGKVKVWGLGLPSETKTYLKDDSVTGLYLWDPQKLTYETAKLVKSALDGTAPKDGDKMGDGTVTVKDGIVTLPLRLEINKGNVDSLKF